MTCRFLFLRLPVAAALLALLTIPTPAAAAEDPVFTTTLSNVAIRGYDPVVYFTEAEPVEGSSDHTYEWNGAEWRFASAENRDRFAEDPERWAPQYGGYCAWAVSRGYTASTDPEAWTVVGDRLFLNYSLSVMSQWQEDRDANIEKADENWPGVLED